MLIVDPIGDVEQSRFFEKIFDGDFIRFYMKTLDPDCADALYSERSLIALAERSDIAYYYSIFFVMGEMHFALIAVVRMLLDIFYALSSVGALLRKGAAGLYIAAFAFLFGRPVFCMRNIRPSRCANR